jgi:AraC family transcriptional regulator
MNREFTLQRKLLPNQLSRTMGLSPLAITEAHAHQGEWIAPAVDEVRLALALSDFSATWRGVRGFVSENVSAGTMAICEFNQSRRFEMRNPTRFAIVLLRDGLLEQTLPEGRRPNVELQPCEVLQDVTLYRLMEVLLQEKRDGFQSGAFFLDGVATALASYLVRHYSVDAPVMRNSVGGMAPAILRRCIDFMEAHLEGDLRLLELAGEAGISPSHFIRSFRQSTGKTPYQFLLERRVERAQTLIRNSRASLTEVALASGFADQHHLARVFRRVSGMTPSSYRRSLP